MERLKRVVLFIFCAVPYVQLSHLNVAELRETFYDVNIDSIPLGFDETGRKIPTDEPATADDKKVNKDEQTMVMTSQYGQRFACTLPVIPQRKEEEELVSGKQEFSTKTIADVVSAGFYARKCTKREIAWWTYEVCFGSDVKQYHAEVTGAITSVLSLGYFAKNLDLPSFKPKPDRPLYFEQQYLNGTLCDLTGKPRTTIVRFSCEELLETDEVYIDEVDESSTCEYLIRIKSGSLCKLGEFLPVDRPRIPLDIVCRPLLEGEQVDRYVNQLEKEKEDKKATDKLVDLLYKRASSVQKQRYARKRLSLKEPHAARKAKAADKRLKDLYEGLIRESWRLNAQFSEAAEKDLPKIVLDDYGDADESYLNTEDEERGNLHWYFKDPFWDRTYFPPTFAYVRAANKFDHLLKQYGDFLPREREARHFPGVFAKFLKRVEEGLVTEADLSNLLGPLSIVFEENRIPATDNQIDLDAEDGDDAAYFSFQKEAVVRRLKSFENKVIASILNGDRFEPKTVMSKVSRDLLSLRNLQERVYKLSHRNAAAMPSSYANTEKVFMMYKDAYNRAIKRFDRDEYFLDSNGNVVDGPGLQVDLDKLQAKDLKPENAKLIYHDELAHELHEVFPSSESGAAWEENRAQSRMERRAKRHNLRKLVEAHFRRAPKSQLSKHFSADAYLKKRSDGIKIMKDLLKKLLKGTGVPEEADVTVHLVTTDGEIIGTTTDDSKIANLVKAWLEEQSTISDEIDRQFSLDKAYAFGASKEEKEARKETDKPSRSDLPIIREML